jgi:predicted nucleic acid-binding protein
VSRYVIDTSVAVKWLVPEVHTEHAQRLRAMAHELLAPEFLMIELANTLLKKARRGEIRAVRVVPMLSRTAAMFQFLTTSRLIDRTVAIATQHSRSVYDALYVAHALDQRCQLITADRKLYDALRPAYAKTMLWVEDIP